MPFFLARKLVVTVQELESNRRVATQDFMGRMSGTGKMRLMWGQSEERRLGKSLCPLLFYVGWMWSLLFSMALAPKLLAI